MKKKLLALLLGLSLITTFAAGCSSKTSASNSSTTTTSAAKKGGTIKYGILSSPKGTFNPLLSTDIYDGRVNQLVYSTLINLDANNKFVPGLAESYKVSDDNLTVTFKLNKKAKWHDGEPFTAADVAFTFTSIASPDYTGTRFAEIDKLVGAKDYHDKKADSVAGIKVIDDSTISFTYSEVFAPALANFSVRAIIPKHIWEKVPVGTWEKQSDLLKKPVGTGAFKLTNFTPDQSVELTKNDDYFLGAPNVDGFIFKVVNQDTAQSELINGNLDITAVTSLKQSDLHAYTNSGMKTLEYAGTSYQFLTMNNDNPLFSDKKVRQAITYAIDRKGIVDKLLEGHAKVLNAPLAVSSWAYPTGINEYEYNVDKAKSLLKEAGWTDNNGILEKDGKQFKATLIYPTGNKTREQSAPIIQQNLKAVGIDVTLVSMDFATLKSKISDQHDYELGLMGFSLELDPADAKTYWNSAIANKPGFNLANFKNETSDKLIEQGAKSLDQAQRKSAYNEWAKLMNEEVPFVYLYSPNEVRAYNPNLKNYNYSTYTEFPNIQNWYLDN